MRYPPESCGYTSRLARGFLTLLLRRKSVPTNPNIAFTSSPLPTHPSTPTGVLFSDVRAERHGCELLDEETGLGGEFSFQRRRRLVNARVSQPFRG